MALTPSTMVSLGTSASPFELRDTRSDCRVSLEQLKSPTVTVVMFISNHCPYVVHILDKLVEVANSYQKKGVAFIAISSNDVNAYPADAPEKMAELAASKAFSFPYLYDESQDVARAYDAACTPDFFVYDSGLKLVYRGQFDRARPGNSEPVTGFDLTAALDAILSGQPVNPTQIPSMGCNVKWKKNA